MIVRVEFDTWHDSWKNLPPEGYAELRAAVPDLPETKETWGREHTVDLIEIQDVVNKYRLELKLHPMHNGMLVSLKARVAVLEQEGKLTRTQLAIGGAVVQIHVPNIGLIAMNEVKVLEDACTDWLQEELDKGWSILAVCPPNAQRRPDYILGRSNPGRKNV
jgi:hypothetical protein